jgi:hypothetical protein
VGEAAEPERDSLDALDQVVDCLGRPVGHAGAVPRGDLVPPPGDRAAEPLDLRRAVVVLEVLAETGDELVGEFGVLDLVDRPDDLLGVPRGADLAAGIAGPEKS